MSEPISPSCLPPPVLWHAPPTKQTNVKLIVNRGYLISQNHNLGVHCCAAVSVEIKVLCPSLWYLACGLTGVIYRNMIEESLLGVWQLHQEKNQQHDSMGNDSPRQHSKIFSCDLQTADTLRVSFLHLYITAYITFSFKNKICEFCLLLEPCKFYYFLSFHMIPLGREGFDSETIATQRTSSLNLVVRERFFLLDSCVNISVAFCHMPVLRHSDLQLLTSRLLSLFSFS